MSDELTDRQKTILGRNFDMRVRQLYFSPKKRASEKEMLTDMLRQMKARWPALDQYSQDDRYIISTVTAFCSRMLNIVLDAENWSQGRRLKNKRFTLWKHVFRGEYLVSFMFFKISEGINKQGTVVFPDGLPKAGKPVPAYFYRHAFATSGYRQVASGTFYQKFMDITTVAYILKSAAAVVHFYLVITNNKRNELTAYALP